jgi:hypothetical protein
MHAVIETPAFVDSAVCEGVTEDERADIVAHIAQNPTCGDLIKGTGGARKVRFAAKGRGKSGGYRIITYFGGEDMPVFLIDIYGKGSKATLSQAERNALRQVLASLPARWRAR